MAQILTAPRLRRHRSFSVPSPRVAMELDLPPQQVAQLTDLAAAIHHAAAAATALYTPSPSSHAAAIGSFLSRLDAAAALSCDDQPMAEGGQEPEEDGEGEHMVGEVEEGLRDCVLQGSKRRKRPVPPSWPLGRRKSGGCEAAEAAAAPVLDVEGRRRAAMNLLLQFHAWCVGGMGLQGPANHCLLPGTKVFDNVCGSFRSSQRCSQSDRQ
ncbi:uncharacterized protein LOC120680618 [Panicum virgatum]|uniref:uncharacterized protein LOC120680618 n=1 Tax=Panicum virgatum TaxID=38727 RepID=UPI0019D68807|nr:uncharacterized protein LOC120680618 [Panicum virgatum]